RREVLPAFHFDRANTRFLHQPSGVGQRLLRRYVVRHERHVANHQRRLRQPDDDRRMINDVFQLHRNRRVMPLHHRTQRITDQNSGYICRLCHLRRHRVVGGDHGDRLVFFLHRLKITDCLSHNSLPVSKGVPTHPARHHAQQASGTRDAQADDKPLLCLYPHCLTPANARRQSPRLPVSAVPAAHRECPASRYSAPTPSPAGSTPHLHFRAPLPTTSTAVPPVHTASRYSC